MRLSRAVLWLCCLAPVLAQGHPANVPSALCQVSQEGLVHLRLHFDLLAYALDATPAEVADLPMKALLDGPAEELDSRLRDAESRLNTQMTVQEDGEPLRIERAVFPRSVDVSAYLKTAGTQRLPVMMNAELWTHLTRRTGSLQLRFPDVLSSVVLTVELPGQEPASQPVEPGTSCRPIAINLPTPSPSVGVMRTVNQVPTHPILKRERMTQRPTPAPLALHTARQMPAPVPNPGPIPNTKRLTPTVVARSSSSPVKPSLPAVSSPFFGYIKMGFRHILPEGIDHILFVLGLFLLSTSLKDLLKQVSAFTLAHSLTLALSLYGVVRLPSSIVEPIIALSIVFVAVENVLSTRMQSWRLYVVFLFGLIHGLGFAGALKDAGLARNDFLGALIGFNGGVELGQLAVIACAFAAVGWFRSSTSYRAAVVIPASAAIAVVALFWTVQRIGWY
jgi:hypothetical protein